MGNGLKLPQMIILYLIYITRYFSTESLTDWQICQLFGGADFLSYQDDSSDGTQCLGPPYHNPPLLIIAIKRQSIWFQ